MNSFSAVVKVISDIEIKEIKGGKLAKCRSVHDTSYKENSGLFLTLNFWGDRASPAERFIKDGSVIFVRGNLVATTVENGKTYFDLSCDDFQFVNKAGENGKTSTEKEPKKKGEKVGAVAVDVDDDLPF
jgi:single-stranded DNA-binding protein